MRGERGEREEGGEGEREERGEGEREEGGERVHYLGRVARWLTSAHEDSWFSSNVRRHRFCSGSCELVGKNVRKFQRKEGEPAHIQSVQTLIREAWSQEDGGEWVQEDGGE